MPLLRSALLDQAGFAHAFSMRNATESELLEALGATAIVQVRQVHGARVVDAFAAANQEADALVARAARGKASPQDVPTAVGVRVADCVPVLVADRETGDVAAIHAGWRGVVLDVLGSALATFRPKAPLVAIGPSIGPCCFEVGIDVAAQIGFVVREAEGKAFVDLRAAVRARCRALGVPEACIDDVPGCTKHEPARFHSFRRDGSESGRMLAAIATNRTGGSA